jgi:hypothetical protein
MDYLILTIKTKIQTACGEVDNIGYVCANGISRCKNAEGKDGISFVSSGYQGFVPVENILCITPSTPVQTQVEAFK